MPNVEQIESIATAGKRWSRKKILTESTFRVDMNPRNYRYRVVCGARFGHLKLMSEEFDSREEAEEKLIQVHDKYYGDAS